MENSDSTVNGGAAGAAGAAEVLQGADQGGHQHLLDGLEDHEGSSLGVVEASQLISASAKSQKLVERAVLAIAVLESGQQFWMWRTVCEGKIAKFCMSSDNALTVYDIVKHFYGTQFCCKS